MFQNLCNVLPGTILDERVKNKASYSQPRSHGSAYWPVISLKLTVDRDLPELLAATDLNDTDPRSEKGAPHQLEHLWVSDIPLEVGRSGHRFPRRKFGPKYLQFVLDVIERVGTK